MCVYACVSQKQSFLNTKHMHDWYRAMSRRETLCLTCKPLQSWQVHCEPHLIAALGAMQLLCEAVCTWL